MARDKLDVQIGDHGEVYIRCTKCSCSYEWKPYMPKQLKGKVGKFFVPYLKSYSDIPCKHCAPLMELYFGIKAAEDFIESIDDDLIESSD